jgi:hypothetical protein
MQTQRGCPVPRRHRPRIARDSGSEPYTTAVNAAVHFLDNDVLDARIWNRFGRTCASVFGASAKIVDFSSPVWPLSGWESARRRRLSASSTTYCCTLSLTPRASASTDSRLSKRTAKEHRTGTTSLFQSFWIISGRTGSSRTRWASGKRRR